MLKEAIDRILELKRDPVISIDDRHYFHGEHALEPITTSSYEPIQTQSLQTVVQFVHKLRGADSFFDGPIVALVHSPRHVTIESWKLDEWSRRLQLLRATMTQTPFPFGRWQSQKEFIVSIQGLIAPNEGRDSLLRLVGNVTDGEVRTSVDDGVSQEVNVRAGVQLKDRETIRGTFELRPWRSFLEIEQVVSPFFLRVDDGPIFSLHETDFGAWQITARDRIAQYLSEELPGDVEVFN